MFFYDFSLVFFVQVFVLLLLFVSSALSQNVTLLNEEVAAEQLWGLTADGLRIRKSVSDMTTAEMKDFVNRVKALKAKPVGGSVVRNLYDYYVEFHGVNGDYAHGGPAFLPWHRWFLYSFETDLQGAVFASVNNSSLDVAANPNFALPFWDWENDDHSNVLANAVWNNVFMGGNGGQVSGNAQPVTSGPFTPDSGWITFPNAYPDDDVPQLDGKLRRQFDLGTSLPTAADVQRLLTSSSFSTYDYSPWDMNTNGGFRNALEQFHNGIHNWVGGAMSEIRYSPNDPVFYLHHANIDKLWAVWQQQNKNELSSLTTTYPRSPGTDNPTKAGQGLEDIMPPYTTSSPSSMLNYPVNLGYRYSRPSLWQHAGFGFHMYGENPSLAAVTSNVGTSSLFLAYQGEDNGVYLSYISTAGYWVVPYRIFVTDTTSAGPAIRVFKNRVCLVMKAQTVSQIYFSSSSNGLSGTWPDHPGHILPNDGTTTTPCLVTLNNLLYLFFLGTDQIAYVATYDGESWSRSSQPFGARQVASGIAAESFGGRIYVAMKSSNTNIYIGVSAADGTFPAALQLSSFSTRATPSFGLLNNKLYLLYMGSDYALYLSSLSEGSSTWTSATNILSGDTTGASPSIRGFGGQLFCVYKSQTTTELFLGSTYLA